jgi:hypothetical protein
MGQATRRELALGLRNAEASLIATLGRSRWRGWSSRDSTTGRGWSSRDSTTAASEFLGALDLLSRLGPRAVTAANLRDHKNPISQSPRVFLVIHRLPSIYLE